jgi:peptidoglycan-N-acetylglucosamine deacetylase
MGRRRLVSALLAFALASWSVAGAAAAGVDGSTVSAPAVDASASPADVTPTPTDPPPPPSAVVDSPSPEVTPSPLDSAPATAPASAGSTAAGSTAAPTPVTPARAYRRGSGAGTIALTFDDGYNAATCRLIFNILRSQHVAATFFPYSSVMSHDAGFWRAVAEAGYPIGNHTATHPDMTLLSYADQLRQIEYARWQIETITGVGMLNVFRPPYGDYDSDTLLAAGTAGFPVALNWDISSTDDQTNNVGDAIAAAERGRGGSVVLMHCGPAVTPYILPYVIDYYRKAGFTFVTVGQMFGVAWGGPPISFYPGPIPPVPTLPPLLRRAAVSSPEPSATPADEMPAAWSLEPSPAGDPEPAPLATAFEVLPSAVPAEPKPSPGGGAGGGPAGVVAVGLALMAVAAVGFTLGFRRVTRRPPRPAG